MATIYDVAKRAGVSPKTVSRVLNRDPMVSAKTREGVTAAMEALSYVPSHAARSIRSNKSGLVGMITGAISGANENVTRAGQPELFLVQGAQSVIEQSGKTLLISDTGGQPERVPGLIRTFQEHRVEGLLYVADFHKPVDAILPAQEMKMVLVNCFDAHGTPAVLPDDETGQYLLTRAVLAAGHTRIAYLTLLPELVASRLRLSGYTRALNEAGIEFDPALIHPVDLFGANGEHALIAEALDHLLASPNPPTAICCGNDRLAMSLYGILRKRGVALPEDMSVVGFDDFKMISEALYPGLTTAQLPYTEMGARAAEILLGMLSAPETPLPETPVRIAGDIRMRGSLVAPTNQHPKIVNLNGRKKK